MGTETAKFALELEDGISAASESAEDALQSLQSQIQKDSKALAEMKKAMRQMQSAGSVDIAAYRKLKTEIDSTQDSIGQARAAFVNLGGDFSKIGRKAKGQKIKPNVEAPKGLTDILSAVDALPGPLSKASKGIGGMSSKASGLAGALGVAGAAIAGVVAAAVLLVATMAALAAATAKATVEILKYAAAQSDAMRSERLRLAGLGTLRRWMRLTSKDAAQMSESINRVSERVPLARSEIAGYGQDLHRLGIRGRAAESALEALSMAQAVQGDLGRRRLMMLVRMAGHSEGAMRNLAERVRKELGGNAAAQMRSLGMLGTKLRESFRALFTGLNLEPLLSGLYRLSRLFSQATESGRAMRAILSAVLQPFIDELGAAAGPVEYFFKEMVILALRVAIVFVRVRNAITRALGSGVLGQILQSRGALEALRVSGFAAGLAILTLVVAVTSLAGVFAVLAAPMFLVLYAMYRGIAVAREFGAAIAIVRQLFSTGQWRQIGVQMVFGIVDGITGAAGRLRGAVTGVATDAVNAFRSALGIRSPSSVFAGLGLAIPAGVAEGVERGTAAAESAAGSMMSTTTNNVRSVQGGASRSVSVGELHVHVAGEGEGAEDTARRVTDALRDFFDSGMAAEPV